MTRRTLLVALAAVVVACGQKGPPVPPELVRPTPPTTLIATSTPEGVMLGWRRPMKYSGGGRMRDLARCVIERAPGASGDYTRVGALELDDRMRFRPERDLSWTDASAAIGESYRYRVIAETLDGDHSEPSDSVLVRHDGTGKAPEPKTR